MKLSLPSVNWRAFWRGFVNGLQQVFGCRPLWVGMGLFFIPVALLAGVHKCAVAVFAVAVWSLFLGDALVRGLAERVDVGSGVDIANLRLFALAVALYMLTVIGAAGLQFAAALGLGYLLHILVLGSVIDWEALAAATALVYLAAFCLYAGFYAVRALWRLVRRGSRVRGEDG